MNIVYDKDGQFDITANRELLNVCYSLYSANLLIYNKMYSYYCGCTDPSGRMFIANQTTDKSDVQNGFNTIHDRTKHKVGVNYMKKFIKEEVSYSVGNDITYISHSGDSNIIEIIRQNLAHWDETQDSNLAKNMLIYSNAYELYYIDDNGEFCGLIISPRHGYAYCDNTGKIILFLHIYQDNFNFEHQYIDIYTDKEIIHCNEVFDELPDKPRQKNVFGKVPVGIAVLSDEDWLDTIYNDIKALQDSFEINLTNISQEITELRNAYLWLNNIAINPDDYTDMKKKGILETKGDNNHVNASWLVKNINDSFIQNTLNKLEDLMYKITFHINTNEKMQSNTSGLALKTRLIGLEEKCKLNQKALSNCIKTRLKMLFLYVNWKKNSSYDYKDIKVKFTANIPMDDLLTAQIISQLGNRLSVETGLAQLSFIDNPKEEIRRIQSEEETDPIMMGTKLLNNSKVNGGGEGESEVSQSD